MIKTKGIVLSNLKYGETSLILDILTAQQGVIPMIVSGVRKSKRGRVSVFRPLQQLDLVHYPSKGESLARIKEGSLSKNYQHLLIDVPITALGNFIIECVHQVARELDETSTFYGFTKEHLDFIDVHPRMCSNYHLYFLIQTASLIGYELNNNRNESLPFFDIGTGMFIPVLKSYGDIAPTAEQSRLISVLIDSTVEECAQMSLLRNEKYELLDVLLSYFTFHVPGFKRPKSLDVFKVVFG